MPTVKNHHRRGSGGHDEEKNRRGMTLSAKSSSFHGRSPMTTTPQLLRPKTLPDLESWKSTNVSGWISPDSRPTLTKLLLNVTIQGSLGPVQVVMTPESTVGDLVSATVRQYVKEARRPILRTTDPSAYDLHYSQFSLESLDRREKLMALGSRNFFLCPRKPVVDPTTDDRATTSSSSCSKQAERVSKIGVSWLKFMDFLL